MREQADVSVNFIEILLEGSLPYRWRCLRAIPLSVIDRGQVLATALTILHSSARIHLKLPGINRSSETRIVLSRILIVSIVFGVVDMLRGEIDTESFFGDFESDNRHHGNALISS